MKTIELVAGAVLLCSALNTFAQLQSGEDVVIHERTKQDLYVAGGTVTINAPVEGDLIVAGGTVTVNDTVTQDILVAGGTIFINGSVGDDIRGAGGKITVSGSVKGDIVATGGTLNIQRDVVIGGNLISSGGEVVVSGDVKGLIRNASGTFTFNGRANRELDCRGGKIIVNGVVEGNSILAAETIELGPEASLRKEVRYWNEEGSMDFGKALVGGQATYDPTLEVNNGRWHYLGFASFLMVLWYLGTALVMVALIHYLFSNTLKKSADTVKNFSLKSLGLGALFLVGIPAAIVIAVITIVAIPIGVLLLFAYITVILLGTIIVAILIAHWINNTFYQSSWSTARIVLTAFGIFVILKLASLTPFVGPLVMLLLGCMAFGGILQNVKWKHQPAIAST